MFCFLAVFISYHGVCTLSLLGIGRRHEPLNKSDNALSLPRLQHKVLRKTLQQLNAGSPVHTFFAHFGSQTLGQFFFVFRFLFLAFCIKL